MKIIQVNNLSNDEYHNSEKYKEYWSSSNIKEYLKTPREAIYQKTKAPKKQSDVFTFGNQLHDFFASKHFKGQPFEWNVFEPPINLKTGLPYGKTTKAYIQELEKIDNPITSSDMELINDIWQMVLDSKYSWFFEQRILSKGVAEASFFVDGIHKYKYRPDVVTDKYIFDYKSIDKRYWKADKLNYRILEFEYDISAAFYQYFEHERTGIWKPFYIIWLMKDPPFDILISNISQYCYEPIGDGEVIMHSGANVFAGENKLKDQHEACQMANQWPGLANQFDSYNGLRLANFAPRYDRGFDEFEIELDNF